MYDLTEQELLHLSSETLFDMVLLEIQVKEDTMKPIMVLANLLKVSEQYLYNVRNRKAKLGFDEWLRIAKIHPLVDNYWRVQMRAGRTK